MNFMSVILPHSRTFMKTVAIVLSLLGIVGLAFGAWGLYTPEGRSRYDEMDGLYPLFSGVAGGILISIAIVLAIIINIRG